MIMENRTNDMENRWPGLSSYPDPDKSEVQLKFCGRDNESYDVANLIDNNIFVTLYGKSGTGKTSLLKAGVFPRLRKSNYFPFIVRLGVDAKDMYFQECILNTIKQTIEEIGSIENVYLDLKDYEIDSEEYLWKYFATTRFLNSEGQVIFPVIVLDQFEEVLRERKEDVAILLRQIYFLMDGNHALSDREFNEKPYSYDFNYRFVVSIREDELYRIEDCIDENYLVNMKHCRYRLRNLSDDGIRDAILTPGDDLFLENERDEIVRIIKKEVLDPYREDGGANTIILSLVCSLLFDSAKQAGMPYIPLDFVQNRVKGSLIKDFYRKVTKDLSNHERSYIKDNLVDSLGRRDSVPIEEFYNHVEKEKGKRLFEGENRILQSISSTNGVVRVELIHDILAEYLKPLDEKSESLRKISILLSLIATAMGIFSFYLSFSNYSTDNKLKIAMNKEVELSLQKAENKIIINSLSTTDFVTQIKPGSYMVDDIIYDTISPSESHISEWKKKYHDICKLRIEQDAKKFQVPKEMMEKDPCLVYLVLTSRSINDYDDETVEKQSWFDLYTLMSNEQVYKLYNILYRERYELAQIEAKYSEKKDSISIPSH